MATKPTYNHKDIKRYLQKQMSTAEMHTFEKAMMSDPFLADALEGFQETDATLAEQHLSEINRKIKPKKNNAKVVGLTTSAKWLRIAAMFIVLTGAGFITYRVLDKPGESTEIAAVQNHPTLPVDSISATEETLAQQTAPGKAANGNANANASSPVDKEDITAQGVIAAAPPAVESSTGEAAGLALVDTAKQIQSSDASIASVTASAPKDLNQVVAQKRSAAPASREFSADLQKRRSAAPAGDGWVKFQAYIDKEVNLAKERNNALNAMQVELEFSVDDNGNIADIKVISASNTEVAKVAVDILKKSPRWAPLANNPKAKIVVNF
jgi:hypothetical protein